MQVMEAFTQARQLLTKLQFQVSCSNRFAYRKLCRVDEYLAREQEELGTRIFADDGMERRPS